MARSVLVIGFPRLAYSLNRFREELRRRGVEPLTVSPADFIPIACRGGRIVALDLERPDGVIHTWWGGRGASGIVLESWEQDGSVVANSVAATHLAANKFLASAHLAAAGLPQLPTALSTDAVGDERIGQTMGFPLVLKPAGGSSGQNTHLVRDLEDLHSVASLCRPYDGFELVLQPFVTEAGATDRRVFVLDGRVLASIERVAPPGDFRSNVAQGGSTRTVSVTPDEAEAAILATRTLGLDYAGVDVIATRNGPIVLEVNGEPQFQALEGRTGVNVAGAVVEWVLVRCYGARALDSRS